MSLLPLLNEIKELRGPKRWSEAVVLSRSAKVMLISDSDNEVTLRVLAPNRPVAATVTLWPEDLGWSCDCEESFDPCIHVAVAAISLNSGVADTPQDSKDTSTLTYRLIPRASRLSLERAVVTGGKQKLLKGSLVKYLGGVKSGRIRDSTVSVSALDIEIDDILKTCVDGLLSNQTLIDLAPKLAALTSLYFNDQVLDVTPDLKPLSLELVDRDDSVCLRVDGVSDKDLVFSNGAIIASRLLQVLDLKAFGPDTPSFMVQGGVVFSPNEFSTLIAQILPEISNKAAIHIRSAKLPKLKSIKPRIEIRSTPLETGMASFTGHIVYGEPVIAEALGDRLQLLSSETAPIRLPEEERVLLRTLQGEYQLNPCVPKNLTGDDAGHFIERVTEAGIFEKRPGRGKALEDLYPTLIGTSDKQVSLVFATSKSKQAVATNHIFTAWQEGRGYLGLADGTFAKLPTNWLERYGKSIKELLDFQDQCKHLPAYLAPAIGSAFIHDEELIPDFLTQLKNRLLQEPSELDLEPPADISCELRSYQREGISWLLERKRLGCGALLADEMGLGKTLQALSALSGKSLVIAPTSVLVNWVEQANRFRPTLSVSLYHGTNRRIDQGADLTVTSYAILRLDLEQLKNIPWDCIVLDEAQTIKNPDSQVAQAAHSLKADFRLALTGTPIENRLEDLCSIFAFLNPGLLPTRDTLQKMFSQAIVIDERSKTEEIISRTKPFILRRKKSDVAPELPAKTEMVRYCYFGEEEQNIYTSLLLATRQEVLEKLTQGKGIFSALEALLRLRQACCHPALLPGNVTKSSSKTELLLELISEAISEGHKVLVFSQWTSLLDLIEPHLDLAKVRFLRLDGTTSNRGEVVNRFQNGDDKVLLMSLKAGGLGITLTAADHVILLDPWWNPAAEAQAADRAHRIGQVNPVMVYRLVVKDSIEEQILALQQEKRELAEAVLSGTGVSTGLNKEDIIRLLQ